MILSKITQHSELETYKYDFLMQLIIGFFFVTIFSPLNTQNTNYYTSLFDGRTLEGWEAVNGNNQHFWSVIDGVITGGDGIQNYHSNTNFFRKK